MATFVEYKHGIQILNVTPSGDAGLVLNENFTTIGDLFDSSLPLSGGVLTGNFGFSWAGAPGTVSLAGATLNMNDGAGIGGGRLVLDGGSLYLNSPLFDAAYIQAGADANSTYILNVVGAGLALNGRVFDMNNGSGAGGGMLNLDGATINVNGTDTGATFGFVDLNGNTHQVVNGIVVS